MTWYACGEALPVEFSGVGLDKMVLDYLKGPGLIPNFAPTTYEAACSYLDEELKKPKGERDLLREMCVMMPLVLPKKRKVCFVSEATKVLFPLSEGEWVCYSNSRIHG